MLGKRKRDIEVVPRRKNENENLDETKSTTIDSNEVFRRHFEAQFGPLAEQDTGDDTDATQEDGDNSEGESDGSEWSGISGANEPIMVEVVDSVSTSANKEDEFHRARQKAFMSSRPPRDVEAKVTGRSAQRLDQDDAVEQMNMKHDLDLQRLLQESHLLERSKTSSDPSKERRKALDLRVQALGAKDSLFTQHKMPVSHRVGIVKKAELKEARRRHDAKENGVILEKVSGSNNGRPKRKGSQRRDRGVDQPGVGRFSGGTLKLSRRDVASIQGPSTAAKKGKRR